MSSRVTFGLVPSRLFRSENMPCSPDAKWVVWLRQSAHCSDEAQAPARQETPRSAAANVILDRITLASSMRCLPLAPEPPMIRAGPSASPLHFGLYALALAGSRSR